jgi:hypothetical protein
LWQFLPRISPVEGAQMKSLYDLLGARENDDAEALKKAFRRAIKASHPDLHPSDPDAAERFREIITAHALLGDAKQRASYDRLLQLEREYFQLMLKRQQRGPTFDRQRPHFKWMGTTAAVAAVGALISGYGLLAPMHTTTTSKISGDEHVATTGVVVEKDTQTATVVAAAGENENSPTAAAKVDAAKGNVDNAGKPVEDTGTKVMAPTDRLDQGEPRDKDDGTEVPNGASKPRTHEHNEAQIPIGANKPNADKREDESNEPSDDAAAIMRFVMQRLREGGDAQAMAGRDLASGPTTNNAKFYEEIARNIDQIATSRGKPPSTASGHDTSCFPSASAVVQQHPRAWPSWTLRAPRHEGTRCWYPATRIAAHEHQSEAPRTETVQTREKVDSRFLLFGFGLQ